ncbi:hypothetical protein AB0O64_05675 [Streptomyces sp. NPDC088341]
MTSSPPIRGFEEAPGAGLTGEPCDEEFHAKLPQVIDLHLAATAFLS